jgi:DNA-binding response OmpR family regulator
LIRVANKRPDALLVDYRLRNGATGVQAIEAIRGQCSHDIPALILSGDTAPERLMEVAQSGLAMMHKPVQPAILRAFLSSARRQNRSDHMPAS